VFVNILGNKFVQSLWSAARYSDVVSFNQRVGDV